MVFSFKLLFTLIIVVGCVGLMADFFVGNRTRRQNWKNYQAEHPEPAEKPIAAPPPERTYADELERELQILHDQDVSSPKADAEQ